MLLILLLCVDGVCALSSGPFPPLDLSQILFAPVCAFFPCLQAKLGSSPPVEITKAADSPCTNDGATQPGSGPVESKKDL
eukprot:TsM_000422800 transcript=TsM_000422800 gene=TsM_000422800